VGFVPIRRRPTCFAEAALALFVAVLIASLGTGLGLAAAAVQRDDAAKPVRIDKIVRPFDEDSPALNRDRKRLGRDEQFP
jgi:hypothetical protein